FIKVYRDEVANQIRKVTSVLEDNGIQVSLGDANFADPEDPRYSVILNQSIDSERAQQVIKEYFSYPLRLTKEEGAVLEYGLHRTYKDEIESNAVSKSIEVIRKRIDEFGVSEPEIVSQGSDRIVVQLPGVKDIDRAKALIGKTAKLEFKMVNDEF